MTNNSREHAPEAGKKKKPSFYYQEVRSGEDAPGTLDKDLGARWGLDQGKSENREAG